MQINITELVAQAQNSERSAFSKLYQLTFKSSCYLALRITGNESSATQSVEASYKKAFSSIGTLKNPESFEAWIKHITAVKSIELLKQNNQLIFDGQAVLPSDIIEDGCEFLPKGLEKSPNAGKAINKIVDSLPDCQRVITVLYYFNEMPISHIARILACTENDVIAELYSARNNIKKCIDRMINRETKIYPSANKPLLALILQSSCKQQAVDETLLRTVFASATEGMFAVSTKQPAPETVSAPTTAPVSREHISEAKTHNPNKVKPLKEKKTPNTLKKLNTLTSKQKITAIVCAAVAILLIATGVIVTPKLITKKEDNNKINNTDTVTTLDSDNSMINEIKPFEDAYDKILKECYSYDGDNWKEALYTFAYIDNNEIPDMIFMLHEADEDLGLIFMNGEEKGTEETFHAVELSHILFGEKGCTVEIQDTVNKNTLKTEFLCYREFKYVNGLKTNTQTLQYSYKDYSSGTKEEWLYVFNEKAQFLNSCEEFNKMLKDMLSGYQQIVAGYSVEDYINSAKSITDFIKKSSPVGYEYRTKVAAVNYSYDETTTVPPKNNNSFEFVDASSSDLETLEDDLNVILTFCDKYNYNSDNAYEIVLPVNCTTLIYNHYFDTEPQYAYGNDPLNYFKDTEYYVFDGEDVDWIISNVFNQTPDHNLKTKDRYYYNGNYYAVFYPSSCPITEVSIDKFEKQADGSYIFTLELTSYVGEGYGSEDEVSYTYNGTVKAALKNIDGKKVWSLFTVEFDESEYAISEETSVDTMPEWEQNYLKELETGNFDNYEFILTDLDSNDIPDMILIMHRSRGALTYYFMNGNTDHEDGAHDSIDEIYIDKYGSMIGKYIYRNGNIYSESYNYYIVNDGEVILQSWNDCNITYTDDSQTEILSEEYSYMNKNLDEKEIITKSDYEFVVNDVNENWTLAKTTSVESFKNSGNELSDYYVNYRIA